MSIQDKSLDLANEIQTNVDAAQLQIAGLQSRANALESQVHNVHSEALANHLLNQENIQRLE